jgi:hypothetical protein
MIWRQSSPCRIVLLAVALAWMVLIQPPAARADTTYVLTATPTTVGTTNQVSEFSITYNDTGDGLFELGELISWTNMTDSKFNHIFTTIDLVPEQSFTGVTGGTGSNWAFLFSGASQPLPYPSDYWSYSQSPVPLPASAILLGSGLLGLALARRQKWFR